MLIFAKIHFSTQIDTGALLLMLIGGLCIWGIMHLASSDKHRRRIVMFFQAVKLNIMPSESPFAKLPFLGDGEISEIRHRQNKDYSELYQQFLSRFLATLSKTVAILRDCLWMIFVSVAIILTTYLVVTFRQ